jgi:hypothetical protein
LILGREALRLLLPQELALLAHCRAPHLPRVRVVVEMPESDRWSVVNVDVPFESANHMLGVQLDSSIAKWVPVNP